MAAVELFGESFRLHEDGISEYALLEFASAQRDVAGGDADTATGMAALFDLVIDTLAEDDRGRFKKAARKHRAKAEDLMKIITVAAEQVSERPTSPPSVSSDGPTSTPPKSESAVERAERAFPGRPDLQMVTQYAEWEKAQGAVSA